MITEVQLPDYYQLLGVQPGATQKEIDRAYQKLISKFDSSGKKLLPQTSPRSRKG